MPNRILHYLICIFLVSVLVTTTTANEPNAQDITVSDEQITVSTTNVLEVGEDAFNYVTPRVKEEFAEDDFGSARSDAKMRELSQNANDRLFQDFITNKDNAGLLMSFLMKFDLQSLRSLKLGVFENSSYKNSLSGAGGKESVLSKAEESLWREHKKSFSDRRETIEESIRAVEKAKDAVTGGAKNPAYREAEQKIKSLRVELDREETQMRASFRLHLKAIEKELGFNWFARYDDDRRQFLNFNRGLLANKDQDVTSASKVEFIDHKKNKSSHTVFKELNNRVDYVRELAMAAGRDKNEANKWAMVYILSWQFTKDNIDLAIKQKMKLIEESEDQSAPGSDVEDTGDDNSDSGDSSVGPVDTSKWNNEQRSRFNAFSTGLMKTTNFSFMGNNQEGKQIIGAYAGVSEAYKQGVPKLQDNLENVFLPKVQEYKNNPKFQADTSSEASAIKKLIKDFEIEMGHVATAKAALRKQGDRLQKYINQYDASVKLNDLADKTKLVNFLRRAVQSGAKITEAENLASRIRNYTQDMLNVIDRSLAAFQTWKEVHKEYKEWEEGNNQDRDRIVEWIKNFDKRRKSIANLHNYGKVAGELVTYVKSKHAERFDSLNIPFSSQITTSCLSLLKGASLEDLKIAKSENPASLDVPVDTLEKQAEQRLFCYANYEWIMKEQASSTEGVKLFDDGRDTPSLAVSMSAIYKFMGTEKDSVKIPEKYDFSIYEGMGSFLKFVDNFRTLFIKYLKSEFKKKGKDIEELSPWTKEDEVTVQRTEHDSVSFRFPAQVLFDTLKATVKPEGHTALKDSLPILLDLLGRDHTSPLISKLVIEGHADSRSAPNYVGESGRTGNDGLSDDRADAVFNYWNQSGASEASAQSFNDFQSQTSIAVERKGYGSSRPVKDDSGAEDMDRSRRVEIKFALNLNAIATIQNDWNKLQQWNEIFNGDLSNGTSQDQNEADSSNDEDSSDSTSESEGSSDADSASEESTGSDDSSETDDDESEGSSSESDADQESQSDQVGYPATHSDSKSQLNDYLFAVEKSGESPKVGTNDLFTVEGEGIMSSFSIDGSYRNVKLNESMIEWLKDNKERVENHDSYFGTSYSEEYNKIYNLYVNKRGEAKLRSIKRDPSWRGPALDKDKLYTLPVTEDMKVLQTVVRKMDDNYSQDVEGLKGQEWQTKIVQELSDISESARLMGYPKNNQSRLYDYGRWQRKISIKPEVALRLSNAIKAASHYDQAHRPMELLAPQLKVIYDQLVNPNGKPKALYHSKPNRPRGGHALRGWKQTWADREIHTPQDIDSKLRKFTELLEGVRF